MLKSNTCSFIINNPNFRSPIIRIEPDNTRQRDHRRSLTPSIIILIINLIVIYGVINLSPIGSHQNPQIPLGAHRAHSPTTRHPDHTQPVRGPLNPSAEWGLVPGAYSVAGTWHRPRAGWVGPLRWATGRLWRWGPIWRRWCRQDSWARRTWPAATVGS